LEDVLGQEVLAEKAGTLSRLLERLEKALDALAAFDEAQAAAGGAEPRRHAELIDAAAEALWHVAIQRELMGLRQQERFMRELGVPARVRIRMGVRRKP
jgi:hypothetical protein